MDYFGRHELEALIGPIDGPAVSIYIPTSRDQQRVPEERLTFMAAVKEARQAVVAAGGDGSALAGHLDDALAWADTGGLGDEPSDGLAWFGWEGGALRYRLPMSFERFVGVGDTFYTAPLVRYLQSPERFWVLGLSTEGVRLWEGGRLGLLPVDLRGVPSTLREALGFEVEHEKFNIHSTSRQKGAVYHGYGIGSDDTKDELQKFFRMVDAGLVEMLGKGAGPVVLASVAYYQPIYRDVTRLALATGSVEGNVDAWSDARLFEAAQPCAEAEQERLVDRAVEEWERAMHQDKAEPDPASAYSLAFMGRVRHLLVEADRRLWAVIDREGGRVTALSDTQGELDGAVELLGELAEQVLLKGGRVSVAAAGKMPTETGVGALLR